MGRACAVRLMVVALCAGLVMDAAQAALTKLREVEGVSEYRLDNGLRVLLVPDASRPVTSVTVTYLVGSRMESNGETGMAHLLEHLMFKGTPHHPNLNDEFTRRGMQTNGRTGRDVTSYYETFAASPDKLAWALRMEADRMVHSNIAQRDLATEMTVVRNEMERGENDNARTLDELVKAEAYRWHPYGRAVIGARADVENVPIASLQAFYRKYYQPDNAVVVVAGSFEPRRTLEEVSRSFGAIARPPRTLVPTYTIEPPQEGPRRVTLQRRGAGGIAEALYHVPPAMHRDIPVLLVLREMLAINHGPLHKDVCHGVAGCNVTGTLEFLRDPGTLQFSVMLTNPEIPADKLNTRLVETLEKFAARGIADEALQNARQNVLTRFRNQQDDAAGMGVGFSPYIAAGDWRSFFWLRDAVAGVSSDDVKRVAQTYLKSSNRTLGEFVPSEEPDIVRVPGREDLSAILDALPAHPAVDAGEAFNATPENIEAHLRRMQLPNGMQLVMLPKHTRGGRVALTLRIGMGDAASLNAQGALISLIPPSLLGSRAGNAQPTFRERLNRLETALTANTQGQTLTLTVQTHRERLPELIALLREMLREPRFTTAAFYARRDARSLSLHASEQQPEWLASHALDLALTPYAAGDPRHALNGAEFDNQIRQQDSTDLARFWQTQIGGDHAWLGAVGDFDADELAVLLDKAFGDWRSSQAYKFVPQMYQQLPATTQVLEVPGKANAMLQGGVQIPVGQNDADYPALLLANHLLGGGFLNSRLAVRLRQQEGLSYHASSTLQASAAASVSLLTFQATFAPQYRARVEQAVREEVQRLASRGVDRGELDEARDALLEARRLARQQDATLATALADQARWHAGNSPDARVDARIATLTVEEVNAMLRKYFGTEHLILVFAGSFTGTETATAIAGTSVER